MVTQDYMKAKECYHDAVSINQSHLPRLQMLQFYSRPVEPVELAFLFFFNWKACILSCSLLMCGVLAIMSQHNKDAQTFLERATGIDPQSVEAWTLLGETGHLLPI